MKYTALRPDHEEQLLTQRLLQYETSHYNATVDLELQTDPELRERAVAVVQELERGHAEVLRRIENVKERAEEERTRRSEEEKRALARQRLEALDAERAQLVEEVGE